MAHPPGIKPMQSGLRDNNRPVRVAAAHLLQRAQDRILHRVRHLHRDDNQMRLLLAPGNVFGRIVVRLSDAAGIEESKERRLCRHIVEVRRSSAWLEPFPDLRARVAGERCNDGRFACASLAEEPNYRRRGLRTLARLRDGLARGAIPKQNVADRVPEPVEGPHELSRKQSLGATGAAGCFCYISDERPQPPKEKNCPRHERVIRQAECKQTCQNDHAEDGERERAILNKQMSELAKRGDHAIHSNTSLPGRRASPTPASPTTRNSPAKATMARSAPGHGIPRPSPIQNTPNADNITPTANLSVFSGTRVSGR